MAIALAMVLGGGPLLVLIRVLVTARLRRLAAGADVDDFVVTLVERTRGWFLMLVAVRVTLTLALPDRWDDRPTPR